MPLLSCLCGPTSLYPKHTICFLFGLVFLICVSNVFLMLLVDGTLKLEDGTLKLEDLRGLSSLHLLVGLA